MSPSIDTKFKVEPFDGSNYSLWSYKMKMYLMSKGLWDAVSGEAEVASAKEQQAHAAIVLNLNDSQLMHVVTSKTAKEAWDTLKTFHKTQDMANRLWLKEKFSAFKFTASSVSNHVTELEKLVMDMKNAGCEPSEEDVCATMLRSLPSSYESLVQAFRMSVSDFKLADLVSKLIAEEVRQKDSTRVEEATALLAAPLATARKEGSQEVIDIIGNDEEEERTEEPSVEEGFRTPPTHPRREPDNHSGPTDSVPTRGSSTPGRDGEEEWMVRPARKRRGVVRYQDEYPGTRRGEFNLDDFEGEFDSLYCLLTEDDDSERAVSYDEVMRSKYKDEWLRAMESEMKSLEDHRTWTLVDMPSDKRQSGARVDYTETFAPVARKESINMVVAIAAEEDMEAENVDVDTAFLYGDVDEELYMDQPDGFEDQSNPTKKCLLMQALYGTKQAARQWNSKLNKHLESQGFCRSAADPCVYVRRSGSKFSIIVVYVDDLMIFSKTKADITGIKEALKREFSIKELGELKYCLGIEIHRDRESKVIIMNQRAYIQRLAEKFGVENCKAVHTPADSNSKLVKPSEDEVFAPKYPYRELVGALMYLATCTRSDIAQAVGEVAKFCEYYNKSHWVAAKRILKYLKTTQDLGLVFNGRTKGELFGYADANWAGDLDTRRSTTGYVFFLNGSAISWKSKRQPTVATSSTEAEYMVLYNATQEAVWLRQLLKDVGAECVGATTIFQDNQGCIALAKNPAYHSRTKHIHLKYHFLREKVEDKIIVLEYKPTDEMVADGFTKALARPKHRQFIVGLGMDD
ncbi:Retrovirus-related Pol polyprotein from transposon TNT 1-94 [Phytophthora cinnamomi]|uniref:Retrovirus-related Pol polyprotein from transposon TNT 1-94 n=1 Tax=Phytophthora cinnamomi TaxID=4785 RepID=UPI00355A6FEB|nr:Retrovirus-related Pol polyprotein from transposon TNT 1-94 [Phytophthora cinnamomi]